MALEFAANGARSTGNARYEINEIYSTLQSTASGTWGSWLLADSGLAKSSGLWLVEFSVQKFITQEVFLALGSAADLSAAGTVTPKAGADTVGIYLSDGKIWTNGAAVGSGPGATAYADHPMTNLTTRVYTLVFNASTRKVWARVDGTYMYDVSGDPAAGTNEAITIGGAGAIEPMIGLFRQSNGQVIVHQPGEIQYPVAGATPVGFVVATITFSSGAITDASGSSVTESGVIASVCDRATGVQIATTTANISGGAATLAFTADVVNGQAVVVHFHNTSGTFKAGGFLTTVAV